MHTHNSETKNKVRESVHDKVNEATLNWFRVARSKNLPVSGPILQEPANNGKPANSRNFFGPLLVHY